MIVAVSVLLLCFSVDEQNFLELFASPIIVGHAESICSAL